MGFKKSNSSTAIRAKSMLALYLYKVYFVKRNLNLVHFNQTVLHGTLLTSKKKKLTEDGHFLQLCIEIAQVEAVEHGEGSFHQTAFQHQMARSGQDILSSGSSDNQNCHSQL
jgi:hypothetical protein